MGLWTDIATGVTTKSYTALGLQSAINYKFRVFARNVIGYSSPSSPVTILTAIPPGAPFTPTTAVLANSIYIDWNSPSGDSLLDYGAVITGYNLMI